MGVVFFLASIANFFAVSKLQKEVFYLQLDIAIEKSKIAELDLAFFGDDKTLGIAPATASMFDYLKTGISQGKLPQLDN